MAALLVQQGLHPIILDNCSTTVRPNAVLGSTLIKGDIADSQLVASLLTQYRIDTVLHFAAYIRVAESIQNPEKYFTNNTQKTLGLLNVLATHGVKYFIFSSTAAVYGEPKYTPIDEKHPLAPINPYGESKLRIEQALPDYEKKHGLICGSLRYFNAAGADKEAKIGPLHDPRSHLIPIALDVLSGRRQQLTVYGDDYDTSDGTCLRDYIHVEDLCDAHLLLLRYLQQGGTERVFNLGTGQGYSVTEVLNAIARVTGQTVAHEIGARRPGDPAVLVADNKKAETVLGWKPSRSSLERIVEDAWRWEQLAFHA